MPLVSETFNTLLKASNHEIKFSKNITTSSFPSLKLNDLIDNIYKDIDCS